MKKIISILILMILFFVFPVCAVELDSDTNGAVDEGKGGTNATTFGGAPFAVKGANADITSMTGLDNDGVPLAKVANAASDGANSDITSMTGITGAISTPTNLTSKTTATLSKSIGAGGDYATFALAIAACPDLIAHAVTYTIEDGTTLTEQCSVNNKHGITSAAKITIQAEKYFPTSGVIPTADSATATTLVDAALAAAAKGDDYFNGCWIIICDGTGTDNGYVPITDYIDVSGTVTVASWPGTEPDNTSRYLIVGALIDGEGTTSNLLTLTNNTVKIYLNGLGITDSNAHGIYATSNFYVYGEYCAVDKSDLAGVYAFRGIDAEFLYCGLVGNNTDSNANYGGVRLESMSYGVVSYCGLSDNDTYGVIIARGGYGVSSNNFGDLNGTWGTYAVDSGQANVAGTECSGTSGDHSNGSGDGSLAY